MPAQPRPTDLVTPENFFLGLPIVEFAPLVGGVQQPFINLGIVDSAELAKELESIALEDGSSGITTNVLEIVRSIDPELNVGVFNFAAEVLRFALGGATLTATSADPAAAASNDVVTTTDPEDYLDLVNPLVNAGSETVTAAPVVGEAVGTGDGAAGSGAVSGDFSLDFKVRAVGDMVGTVDVNNAGVVTNFTAVAVGAASSGNEVEVAVGYGATSGNLQFFVGGVAANVTGDITASYTPSFALVQGLSGGAATAVEAAISDDGGAFTDETTDANSATANDVTLLPATPATNDAFYVGMTNQFNRVTVNVGTAGTGGAVAWEYSQGGGTWAALTIVTDETEGFTVAGTGDVTFEVPSDWVQDIVNSQGPFHYVRARVTSAGAAGGVGTQVWTSQSEDYLLDAKNGRIQVHHDATKAVAAQPIIAGQSVRVAYTFDQLANTSFQPFTQTSFNGAIRIRHLSDQGGNVIWNVPSGQIQVTDDSLTFDDENFMVANVTLKILDAGTAGGRFGTLEVFSKTQAGN